MIFPYSALTGAGLTILLLAAAWTSYCESEMRAARRLLAAALLAGLAYAALIALDFPGRDRAGLDRSAIAAGSSPGAVLAGGIEGRPRR